MSRLTSASRVRGKRRKKKNFPLLIIPAKILGSNEPFDWLVSSLHSHPKQRPPWRGLAVLTCGVGFHSEDLVMEHERQSSVPQFKNLLVYRNA